MTQQLETQHLEIIRQFSNNMWINQRNWFEIRKHVDGVLEHGTDEEKQLALEIWGEYERSNTRCI